MKSELRKTRERELGATEGKCANVLMIPHLGIVKYVFGAHQCFNRQ